MSFPFPQPASAVTPNANASAPANTFLNKFFLIVVSSFLSIILIIEMFCVVGNKKMPVVGNKKMPGIYSQALDFYTKISGLHGGA